MRVYSPSTPIPGLANTPALEELWKQSWARYGWDPVVLPPSRSKAWRMMDDASVGHPTTNPAKYRSQCITRWVDFAEAGGGVMVDMDVLNTGWPCEAAEKLIADKETIHGLCNYCPCAVVATAEWAWAFVGFMFSSLKIPPESLGGCIHSDQEIFQIFAQEGCVTPHRICENLYSPRWEESPLVHVPNMVMARRFPGRVKSDVVAEFLSEHERNRAGNPTQHNSQKPAAIDGKRIDANQNGR